MNTEEGMQTTENQDGKQHLFYKLNVRKRVDGSNLVISASASRYRVNEPSRALSEVKGTESSKEISLDLEYDSFVIHSSRAEAIVRENALAKLSKLLAVGAIEPGELLEEGQEYPRVAPPVNGYQFTVKLNEESYLGHLYMALNQAIVFGDRYALSSSGRVMLETLRNQVKPLLQVKEGEVTQ